MAMAKTANVIERVQQYSVETS